MAAPKNKQPKLQIGALAPKSFLLSLNGEEVRVALDKYENALLNAALAGRLRGLIENHMNKYKDQELTLTPKDIRELAAAARDIAAFSNEVIIEEAPSPMQQVGPASPDDISFDALSKPPEPEVKGEKPPETNEQGT